MDDDFALALQLQSELFDDQYDSREAPNQKSKAENEKDPMSLIDPYWELTDPNPDVRALFLQFNARFFWGRLAGIEVRWSPRMTLCAGLCCYEGRGGLCSVRLSVPLLKLRPRKDLVETLLHEMIHAYLFVTDNNKDHDGHGPEFHKHMYRINAEAGTKITVYHSFHDEVDAYRQHWWRCNGPCQSRKPFYGYVKRSMNRVPSKNDTWWAEHQRTCGGTFTKIKEPENYGKKSQKKDTEEKDKSKNKGKSSVKSMDIRVFGGDGNTLGQPKPGSSSNSIGSAKPTAKPGWGNSSSGNAKSGSGNNSSGNAKSGSGNNSSGNAKFGSTSNSSGRIQPTATVTSGVLQRTGSEVVSLDSDDDEVAYLPGSRTPTAKPGRHSKGSINKPVSQGGSATFDKIKKKKFKSLDFSDSDDDDEMCRLEEISLKEKNKVFGSGEDDISNTGEIEGIDQDWDTVDKDEIPELASDGIVAESKVEDVKVEEIDSNDVQAMLRKVWGEKQFDKTGAGGNKGKITSGLSDIGSGSAGVKRPSTDSDTLLHPKRQKTSSKDSYVIHSASGDDKGSPYKIGDVKNKGGDKVTSPIEKLFKKMKEKGNVSKTIEQNSVTDTKFSDTNASCDTRTNAKGNNSSTASTSELTELAPCPVCSKAVPANSINDHLDLCLTLQAIG